MLEAQRAELDWTESIAPLRQAGQLLQAADGLARRLDDETTLWSCMQALSELPACVTFHPFATTTEWSVDLEREQARAQQALPAPGWAPELTRRARRRQQISVAHGAQAALPSSATRSPRAEQTRNALSHSSSAETRLHPAHAAVRAVPAAGAWSALLAIVQLVEEIEATPESGGSRSAAPAPAGIRQRRDGNAHTVDPPSRARTTVGGAAAMTVRPPPGTTAATNAASAAGADSEPDAVMRAPDGTPQRDQILLTHLVAALWSGAATPRSAQLSPAAAAAGETVEGSSAARPRAPSLLLPARAPREAVSGDDGRVRPADDGAPSTAWPANDPGEADTLAERLNRELLEQAWLRGVDLT
jgi:hypothetical protein